MTASASIVIVQTRWHEDDLIGRLTDPTNPHYSPEEAAKWKIINLPALAEDEDPLGRKKGELLWPERFDMEFMEAQRRLDPRGFSALYQGRPTAEDGDLFRRENIKYFNRKDLPEDMRIYAASDHAVGVDRTRNDATCLLIVGVDRNDDIFLLDCWWEKRTTDKVVDAMLELMSKWKPLIWWAEKGHISKAIGPFLRKRMAEEKVYCRIEEVTPVANKVQRAQSILGRMAMNKVLFPRQSVWTQKATDEILKFPNGRNDDFVDTLAWIGMGLARLTTPGGGIVKTDSLPKVGTLAWVKWDAAQRRKQQFLEHRTGGW
jgi:predicted phage terminase large subunit-like protein